MSNKFDSYQLEVSEVGSFLNSRYESLNPDDFSMSYYGTAGSVVVVVNR